MGLHKWSNNPRGRTLNIVEGGTNFKRKIELNWKTIIKFLTKTKESLKIIIKHPSQHQKPMQIKEITKIISYSMKIQSEGYKKLLKNSKQ